MQSFRRGWSADKGPVKGRFSPRNPKRYVGNPANIIYRSLWERRAMEYFDNHPDVLNWGSEEIIVPYVSPIDNKLHRYFPDFWARIRQSNNNIIEFLIEVKPKAQTMPPVARTRTRRYITEVLQFGVNEAKWKAAYEMCQRKGWKFMILTEDELG